MIRVLIVDDDKLARKGLISIMPWSDHDMLVVGEAANGAKALDFLEQQAVDLMFVDLAMPVMSGIELIEAARNKFPKLRSVMLTFHEEFENVQAAYRHGVLDYISKVRMEQEDDEQVLRRIRQKLADEFRQPLPSPPSVQPAKSALAEAEAAPPPLAKEQWRKLEQDWRSLYWLYQDDSYQRLCRMTEDLNPPVRWLESLFMRVISQVELELAVQLNTEFWPETGELRSALEWMQRCRRRIYALAAEPANLTSTMSCILKAVLFIREQAARQLHADDAADHVNMSRSYFCQIFKKLTGATFNGFLRQERIRAAERLLRETNRSVAWVANAVGYGDTKYFSQIFYQQNRVLPSEFRARYHKGEK